MFGKLDPSPPVAKANRNMVSPDRFGEENLALAGGSRPFSGGPHPPIAVRLRNSLKSLIRATGFDIKRFRPGREEFLESRRIDTILDAGANTGGFGREVRSTGFTGRIVSFEPVRPVFEELTRRIAPDPLWTAHHVALSDRNGTAVINVSHDTTFSSLDNITPAALSFDEAAATERRETVELRRLDSFAAEIEGERLFLKIDTQGHEKRVMAGVGGLLERIHGVQLELSISTFYENNWSMAEALDFMAASGFAPTHFRPNNFHRRDPIAIVDLDCIFRRIEPDMD